MTPKKTVMSIFQGVSQTMARPVETAVERTGYMLGRHPRMALGNTPGGHFGLGAWGLGYESTPSETIATALRRRAQVAPGRRLCRVIQACVDDLVRIKLDIEKHGYKQMTMVFGYRDRTDAPVVGPITDVARALAARTMGRGHA